MKFTPPPRKEAIDLLESYMKNPGRFSVLVLGAAGTGKATWIRNISESVFQTSDPVHDVHIEVARPETSYWEEQFARASEKGVLLIRDVDRAADHQYILMQGLSTRNGLFGFSNKEFSFVPVFTTTVKIDRIKEDSHRLDPKFFDRISQLVIEFPSLRETRASVHKDFQDTWSIMKFPKKTNPKGMLDEWLTENAHKLYGNFRDLDKLAILWQQYSLIHTNPEKVKQEVIAQFEKFNSYPPEQPTFRNSIQFDPDKKYDQLLKDFRRLVKSWALEECQNDRFAASKMLNISHRTMERW